MNKNKLNTICLLFGHRVNKTTDSGYHFCTRCGAHEYYDLHKWYKARILLKPYYWIRIKILCIRAWYLFRFNNKLPF